MKTLRIYSLNNLAMYSTAVWVFLSLSFGANWCVFLSNVCLGLECWVSWYKAIQFSKAIAHITLPQPDMGFQLASHPPRHFKHLSECAEGLHCGSRIFLMPTEFEHILICLVLAIRISFSVKSLFQSFVDLNISCIERLLSTPTASPFDSLDTSFSIGPSVLCHLACLQSQHSQRDSWVKEHVNAQA